MNIANRITVLRIILTFVFIFLLTWSPTWEKLVFLEGFWLKLSAFLVFLMAALTDFFDGRIAKKKGIVSDFGKFMDPVADKILVLAAFATFVHMRLIAVWMFVIIIARDLVITSLRLFALNKGKVLSASRSGKHKTAFQIFSVFWILGFILLKEAMLRFFTWDPAWEKFFHRGIYVLMCIVVGLTLYSGISYIWENRKVITKI